MAIKYKNIVGTGFPNYVQTQLENRKNLVKKKTRSPKDLLWLTNRTGWFRLTSGATVNALPNSKSTEEYFQALKKANKPINSNFNENLQFKSLTEQSDEKLNNVLNIPPSPYTDDLAKKYILQGGTVSTTDGNNTERKTKFDQIYTKNQEDTIGGEKDDLGYKPMPAITSIEVGTRGKWRTTLEGEINIICYNLEQLEIVNRLYMSLGVHVYLEWGHIPYINANGNTETTPINPLDFFNIKDRHEVLQKIEEKKKGTNGNYGALLGRVTNFSYNSNIDGSYNCKIDIIGPGSMLESLRINRATGYDFDITTTENKSDKYNSDLENALTAIKNILRALNLKSTTKRRGSSRVNDVTNEFGATFGKDFFKKAQIKKIDVKDTARGKINKYNYISYADVLNNIYNTCQYKGYNFDSNSQETLVEYPGGNKSFAALGNAWQYVSNMSKTNEGNDDGLSPLDVSLFYGYASRNSKGGMSKDTHQEDDFEENFYITFGHLLALIQHLCIFNERKTNSATTNSGGKRTINPVVLIDFHPENTIMKVGPLQASIDPKTCIVPFRVTPTVKNEDPKISFGKWFEPLEVEKEEKYNWQEGSPDNNLNKNLLSDPNINIINSTLNLAYNTEEPFNKLMNVLVNVDFAITSLKTCEDSNNEVNLLTYLDKILDGINISLGKINNFRAFFDDCSHVVRIIDEHKTEEFKGLIEIPNFGLESLTYDYSISSNLTPKLAAKIVIAAQGQYGGIEDFPEDVLTYNKLNVNVLDRFSPNFIPSLPPVRKQNPVLETTKLLQKLFDHFYQIYTLDAVANQENMLNLLNVYADLNNTSQKYYPDKSATILIPLTFDMVIDGITGIMPYNAFLIPNNRLPIRYQGNIDPNTNVVKPKVAFIIFSIDHLFDSNQWKTKLTGQLIYVPNEGIPDDRKVEGQVGKTPTKLPLNPSSSATYPGKVPIVFESPNFSQPDPKGQPEAGDTITTSTNNGTPITSITVDPNPASVPDILIKARDFIIPNEVTEGIPKKEAYKDNDYTIDTQADGTVGFTWRIGFGSDTITTPGNSVKRVKEGDVITSDQAYADLERRLKTEFKPKVVGTCAANGVDYDSLDTAVKIVFIDCAYNYGSLWNDIVISYRDGGVQGLIQELQRRIDRGASQVPKRRGAEIERLGGVPRYNN